MCRHDYVKTITDFYFSRSDHVADRKNDARIKNGRVIFFFFVDAQKVHDPSDEYRVEAPAYGRPTFLLSEVFRFVA